MLKYKTLKSTSIKCTMINAAMIQCMAGLLLVSSLFGDEPHATLPIGSQAPDFALTGTDGKTHKLGDYAASKLLVIVFTCNHCPTAQLYEPRVEKLADDYRGKGVTLIAIEPNNANAIRLDELGYTDVSDSLEDMKIRSAYRHFSYPYLYDGETQSVSLAYGPKATPHVFIFDSARKLRYEGHIDDNQRVALAKSPDARNAIDALLAGKPVPVDHTRVFGCSTKWLAKVSGRVEEAKRIESQPVNLEMATAADLKKLRLNQTGKVTLVNFWATWCGPCVRELPELEETFQMYRQRDFDLVTVSANMPDEKSAVVKKLNELHATNRNLLFGTTDTDALQSAFDPKWESGVPYTVLLAPDGKILYQEQGELNILKLRRVILANLPDQNYVGHREYWATN